LTDLAKEDERILGVADEVATPQPNGIVEQAVKPLEARPLRPFRRALDGAGDEVERGADAKEDRRRQLLGDLIGSVILRRASAGASTSILGASMPTTRRVGSFSRSFCLASSPTPGAPPRKYTEKSRAAARSMSGTTRSEPLTFSGSRAPSRFEASTRGKPSGKLRSARRYASAKRSSCSAITT
jgi:hypothetical protein